MATFRGRPRKPKPTWRDFLTPDEARELVEFERYLKEGKSITGFYSAARRKLQQRASRRMAADAKTKE